MHGQDVVNWIFLAGFYASVAVGFSLVWGIMNIVNLAHGAFILVGAYVALVLYQQLHLDPFVSIPAAMAGPHPHRSPYSGRMGLAFPEESVVISDGGREVVEERGVHLRSFDGVVGRSGVRL